jgi:uncharacterized protein (DUF58 family)
MPTRHGIVALAVGLVALAIGRVFGVVELFVIGAAFIIAPVVSTVAVVVRHPHLRATRWIHPPLLTAGESGRVDVRLAYDGSLRSTSFDIAETVRHRRAAPRRVRVPIAPMPARSSTTTRYVLPTTTRGLITVGPLVAENRDLLGLAVKRSTVAGDDTIVVVPHTHLLAMPALGRGALGRQLLDRARRLGPGEFHSLRDYIDGDEPRSINWRASARSDDLKVTQRTTEGLHRCVVVLDDASSAFHDRDSFERAVTAAASLVHSAVHAGLTTRFITTSGIDLRGPDVAANTLRHLGVIEPLTPESFQLVAPSRDPSEGLGLVLAISGTDSASLLRSLDSLSDPATTAVAVTTDRAAGGRLAVAARTEREFIDSWQRLTGMGGTRPGAAVFEVAS